MSKEIEGFDSDDAYDACCRVKSVHAGAKVVKGGSGVAPYEVRDGRGSKMALGFGQTSDAAWMHADSVVKAEKRR